MRQVTEAGPTRVWRIIETAHARWTELDRPGWDRFGLTVTENHQQVWLDTPGRHADQEREFLGTSAIPKEEPVWNRLGMGVRAQGILAWAAPDTVMNPPSGPSAARLTES